MFRLRTGKDNPKKNDSGDFRRERINKATISKDNNPEADDS